MMVTGIRTDFQRNDAKKTLSCFAEPDEDFS